MSSIIPQHIIVKVRQTMMEYISHYSKGSSMPKEKPFEYVHVSTTKIHISVLLVFRDLYVEEHPNVTILFADIVNYTAMTTQLNVIDLLDILNEMFGRFDDASAVRLT